MKKAKDCHASGDTKARALHVSVDVTVKVLHRSKEHTKQAAHHRVAAADCPAASFMAEHAWPRGAKQTVEVSRLGAASKPAQPHPET